MYMKKKQKQNMCISPTAVLERYSEDVRIIALIDVNVFNEKQTLAKLKQLFDVTDIIKIYKWERDFRLVLGLLYTYNVCEYFT